jgi:TM2 domain-containing membrane protein YozV
MISTQQQMLIEQRVTNEAKSTGAAYLLWFFLGTFGAHRFYLGRTGTAVTQLLMTIIGWLTVVLVVGIFILIAVGIWLLVDAFLIPGMIQAQKDQVRQSLTTSAMLAVGATRSEPQI